MGVGVARKNEILNYLFGKTSFTPEDTLYLGLKINSAFPSGELSSLAITEPTTAKGYARVSIDNTSVGSDWNASTSNSKTNAVSFTFPESSDSWGTVYGIFISKVATGVTNGGTEVLDDIVYFQNLTSPISVAANTTVYYNAGGLSITIPA